MLVATVATEWNSRLENFKRSLNLCKYQYVLLGFGEKWNGWNWRTKKYLEFLNSLDCEKIVVFVDSYDVIALRHNRYMLETFLAFNKNIVVGAEWYCGSSTNCKSLDNFWGNKKRPYRQYVNCGFVMGYTKHLKKMYENILKYDDDQFGLAHYIESNPNNFALDIGSALVYNSHILDGQFKSNAFFGHFPGPALRFGVDKLYNYYCLKVLGKNAQLQYPSMQLETIIWFTIVITILYFLIK